MEEIRLGVIDIETTGLSQEDGHRIIEVGFSLIKTSDGVNFHKVGSTLTRRINPQRSIDPKAFEVHGISLDMLSGCQVWDDFAPIVGKLFRSVHLIVAHNTEFDIPFVAKELIRVGQSPGNPATFCTMQNGRFATPYGTVPNLGALCFALGVEYDESKAHGAGYDVDVTTECLIRGINLGLFQPAVLKSVGLRAA